MEIKGNQQLGVYVDDKLIGVCTEPFELPTYPLELLPITGPDYELTFKGLWQPEQIEDKWNTAWFYSKYLPRKKKKAFRNSLLKMIDGN